MREKRNAFPVFLLDMAADVAAVIVAYYAAFFLRFRAPLGGLVESIGQMESRLALHAPPDYAAFYLNPVNAFRIILLLATTLCLLNAFFGLYSGRRFLRADFTPFRLLETDFIALLFFVSYLYLSRNQFHPRSTFLLLILIHFLLALLFRKGIARLMARLRARFGLDRHPVLLAGEAVLLDPIEEHLRAHEPHGLYAAGRMTIPDGLSPAETAHAILREAEALKVDTICCADSRLSLSAMMELLDQADRRGLSVKLASPRLAILPHQARIETDLFKGAPLLHFSPTSDFAAVQRLKRIGSVLFSLFFLALAWPLFLLVAILIKATSPGPVLFVQERTGREGRLFRMLKFRTMTAGAPSTDAVETGAFKIKDDPRVTPIGRFLRKFSLDELPQFVNVLRGEMNVVGPRPLPLEDERHYDEPWHRSRHKGLPGITGLWQVSGRSDLTFEQMCVLDIYYLHNASLSLDLALIFRTVVSLLFAEGAY